MLWRRLTEVYSAHELNGKSTIKKAVIKTSSTALFQKLPCVDIHSGVKLQQTYYLLFCHFGFSLANAAPDSISTPDMSAFQTIAALKISAGETRQSCVCVFACVHGRVLHISLRKGYSCYLTHFSQLRKTLSSRYSVDFTNVKALWLYTELAL